MSAATLRLTGTRRDQGTGASRRLRRRGLVPAVVYGPGVPSLAIAVDVQQLEPVMARGGAGQVASLTVGGESGERSVMIKAVSRDPLTRRLIHVDLLQVDLSRPLHITVPVRSYNDEAVRERGLFVQMMLQEVAVEGLSVDLPGFLAVDALQALTLNRPLTVGDLEPPPGCVLATDAETVVLTVAAGRTAGGAAGEAAGAVAGAAGR